MPSYYIKPQPSPLLLQQAQMGNNLITSGLENMARIQTAQQMQDIADAKKPIEDVPTSELQKRHDKLAADLEVSRENALQSGDVKKLKEINKAENDLNFLGDELKKRAIKEMQSNLKTEQDLTMGQQKIAAEKALAAERNARASIFDKFGPGKDPYAGVKVTQKTLDALLAERRSAASSANMYASKYMPVPQEIQDQLDALDLQIAAVKKKLGVVPAPKAAPAAKAPAVTGAPTSDLLNLLNTP